MLVQCFFQLQRNPVPVQAGEDSGAFETISFDPVWTVVIINGASLTHRWGRATPVWQDQGSNDIRPLVLETRIMAWKGR